MFEQVFASLPEGLATMAPGAALGALLEQVDPRAVSPHDAVSLARAWRRQLSHHEARFALAAREAALADPDLPGGRGEGFSEFCADELRAALVESRARVSKLLTQADTAIAAIPELWAAWDAGQIDTDRVRLCVTWTSSLSAEHAARVVRRVLPEAPRLTLSGLVERLQQLATALDPEWAARLYDNTRRQRRVRSRRTEAGTVNLSGLDLPLDAAARSVAHVETLALRAKAAGHPGLIDTIRADVYLALLRPRTAELDDDALVAAVVAAADPTDPRGRPAPQYHGNPHHDPAHHDPAHHGPRHPEPPPDTHPATKPSDQPDESDEPGGSTAPGEPDEPDQPDEPTAPGEPTAADEPGAPGESDRPAAGPRGRGGGTRCSRIEVRVGLATLLGLDEKPAMMPGYGVVHAPLARQYARQLCAAQWRVAVTDTQGLPVAALLARRRPRDYATTPADDPPTTPRPVLELHIDAAALARLRPGEHPGWSEVLAELQQQFRAWSPPDPRTPQQARRRVPSPALARWIQIRDRNCVFPPCRASALVADLDHTLAVVAGGLTLDVNLGPVCPHDHRLKHAPGWHLEQTAPGDFTWTSPTGHTYRQPPQPVQPDLPDPAPGRPRSGTTPDQFATDDEPIWLNNPYPDDPPTTTPSGDRQPGPRPPDRHGLPDDPPF